MVERRTLDRFLGAVLVVSGFSIAVTGIDTYPNWVLALLGVIILFIGFYFSVRPLEVLNSGEGT